MALEPITRQEQIIAGKNLEPVTRMEKFLKEYGGATSPKLLGELVVNGENSTRDDESNALRVLNEDATAKAREILSAVSTSKSVVFCVVTLADFMHKAVAEYSGASNALDITEELRFGGDFNFTLTGNGEIDFVNTGTAAVIDLYPMTIKVYAT